MPGSAFPVKAGIWLRFGAFSAALSILLGAFGAHGLKNSVGPTELGWWETASRYHLAIALATMLFGLFRQQRPGGQGPGVLFTLGSVFFSGSLYAMALGAPRWFGAITPLGGLCMLAGFVWFGLCARK